MSNKKERTPREIKEEIIDQEAQQIPVEQDAQGHLETEAATGGDPQMEALQKALEASQAQAAEYKDGWQRALADFQNYKRRTEAEKAETYQLAISTIIRRYLPILDDLERALAMRPAGQPWADGIELIYRKLQTILDNEGVKRIETDGKPFDPNFHEAVAQEVAEGVESGHIIAVVQHGYMLGERVIRPAQVRVAQ